MFVFAVEQINTPTESQYKVKGNNSYSNTVINQNSAYATGNGTAISGSNNNFNINNESYSNNQIAQQNSKQSSFDKYLDKIEKYSRQVKAIKQNYDEIRNK